jgi:hypothetical protein
MSLAFFSFQMSFCLMQCINIFTICYLCTAVITVCNWYSPQLVQPAVESAKESTWVVGVKVSCLLPHPTYTTWPVDSDDWGRHRGGGNCWAGRWTKIRVNSFIDLTIVWILTVYLPKISQIILVLSYLPSLLGSHLPRGFCAEIFYAFVSSLQPVTSFLIILRNLYKWKNFLFWNTLCHFIPLRCKYISHQYLFRYSEFTVFSKTQSTFHSHTKQVEWLVSVFSSYVRNVDKICCRCTLVSQGCLKRLQWMTEWW